MMPTNTSTPGTDITQLCNQLVEHSQIDARLYEKFHVKRGLRRSDGTGVVAGITNICNVHGYVVNEGVLSTVFFLALQWTRVRFLFLTAALSTRLFCP